MQSEEGNYEHLQPTRYKEWVALDDLSAMLEDLQMIYSRTIEQCEYCIKRKRKEEVISGQLFFTIKGKRCCKWCLKKELGLEE